MDGKKPMSYADVVKYGINSRQFSNEKGADGCDQEQSFTILKAERIAAAHVRQAANASLAAMKTDRLDLSGNEKGTRQ